MWWINIVGEIFGFGRDALNNRAKRRRLEAEQKHSIIRAETDAIIDRITSNTHSDNEIDLITARNKKYTLKDEVITYLFLVPVVIATLVPFLIAYEQDNWTSMNEYIRESYLSLDQLPTWYKWVLAAVVIDVLGFRSFARKLVERWFASKEINLK
tara:strand:+ start:164 stop:628 length:465 start_codon:yes stop_codon:yes gene_type:complete